MFIYRAENLVLWYCLDSLEQQQYLITCKHEAQVPEDQIIGAFQINWGVVKARESGIARLDIHAVTLSSGTEQF
jgi:hypothetical protein